MCNMSQLGVLESVIGGVTITYGWQKYPALKFIAPGQTIESYWGEAVSLMLKESSLPSSNNSYFQNEAINGFALTRALKQRLSASWK